jgi:outer membrane murein-binding lipoprotein Lpp
VTRKASRSDQAKIEEYASSVREVEGRLSRLQANDKDAANDAFKAKRPPNGLPTQLDVHARLMCDIVALAFQADRTRIATMLLANNLSGQVYPFLGLRVDQYGYLVGKLAAIQEGEGTVLDNSCIMLANEQWVAHSAEKVPLVMAGGLGGGFATGRTLDFEKSQNRKFSSLLMTVSDRMGLKLDSFGDSTQQLDI